MNCFEYIRQFLILFGILTQQNGKTLLKDTTTKATKIAILDGVLYIPGKSKMYDYLSTHKEEYNIMSSLLLCEFLFQF